MDIAQCFLEVEILIHLGRSHADKAAGGQTPVGGFDLGVGDDFAQARHVLHRRIGEALVQPDDLAVQVGAVLELFDSGLAFFVELPGELADGAAVEKLGGILLHGEFLRQVRGARGQLVEQVDLLDQTSRGLGQRAEGLAGGVLGAIGLRRFGNAMACLLYTSRCV